MQDPSQVEFAVDFSIGTRDRISVTTYPGPYAGFMWGGPGWANRIDVRQYKEGTLAVDIFDTHSHRAVWHGTASRVLSQSDIDNSQAPIQEAVTAGLANFPPK